MQLELKSRDVNVFLLTEFAISLGWVSRDWAVENMGEFVVTSCKDGGHSDGSQHRQDEPVDLPGEAADIRTWLWWRGTRKEPYEGVHDPKLIQYARRLQAYGLAVVVHPDWIPGVPHLHIAKKKSIYTFES